MPDGIASAASALRYWERRQEVAANNLANVNTTAFKGERVFARLIDGALPVADATTDAREGVITPTGNPLDLAVRGDAHLVVATPNGERWSRGGSWTVDADGYLADANGHRALGERGPLKVISGSEISIDRTGLVGVDGVTVDRLRLEQAPPGTTLQHEGGTLFVPGAIRSEVALDARDIRQGHLEGSNVSSITTLVDLIAIQRNFANAQKALTTLDGIRSTIVNDLGKVSG